MKRYYDFNVYSCQKVGEKLHYMHQNPVARELVQRPEQWKWSSFQFYASGEGGSVKVNDWWWWERKTVMPAVNVKLVKSPTSHAQNV